MRTKRSMLREIVWTGCLLLALAAPTQGQPPPATNPPAAAPKLDLLELDIENILVKPVPQTARPVLPVFGTSPPPCKH